MKHDIEIPERRMTERRRDWIDRPTMPADLGAPVGVPVGDAHELEPREGMKRFVDAWQRWQGKTAR